MIKLTSIFKIQDKAQKFVTETLIPRTEIYNNLKKGMKRKITFRGKLIVQCYNGIVWYNV